MQAETTDHGHALQRRIVRVLCTLPMVVWALTSAGALPPVTAPAQAQAQAQGAIGGEWTPISSAGAPSPRRGHTAVWTGAEMLVWGGEIRAGSPAGSRYDPATDTWASLPEAGAPSPRTGHTAVWTGSEMLVWGGQAASGPLANGARYSPATDRWTPISAGAGAEASPPAARAWHVAVWGIVTLTHWRDWTAMP